MGSHELTPRVRVIHKQRVVREVPLAGPISIGRLPDNDLVLEDDLVSGHHGRIERTETGWRYVDTGSTNGSIVAAGPTLRRGEGHELSEDCQILLGATVLDVRLEIGSTMILKADRPAGASDSSADARQDGPPPSQPRLLLLLRNRCITVDIARQRVTLGRGPRADVHVDDASVSARHAELRWENGRWMLRDLASTNGTRVGVHKVSHARPVGNNTHIILGGVDLLLVLDDGLQPDAERVLAQLEAERRLSRSQCRLVREELAAGKAKAQLGEILVRRGWLSPGEWTEVVSQAEAPLRRTRRLWLWVVLAVLTTAAVVTWALRESLFGPAGG
jgi:pSer/pThr/pTyr-binding forkhead associated (FHA) protein